MPVLQTGALTTWLHLHVGAQPLVYPLLEGKLFSGAYGHGCELWRELGL